MQGNNTQPDTPAPRPEEDRRARAASNMWSALATLFRWRKFIATVTGVAAILSVVIALLLPDWYRAETRLLLPARSGSLLSGSILSDLPTAATSLLGGITGDYLRHLSILDSRTVKQRVVERFDLIQVYDLADSEAPMREAINTLSDNVEFEVDDEYNYLSVQVYDTDPQRAADMANFFVDELNRVNAALATQSATNFRRYVEERYLQTEAEMDSVMRAMRRLQEEYGVLDLEAQSELFYTSVAEMRLGALQAEIEYERLLSEFGPNNSITQAAYQAAQSANRKYEAALTGQERMLPVPKDSLPAVAQQLFDLKQQQFILAKLIEYTRPVLEEARFEEQRKVEAVQVVDPATPPEKKAKPFRALICIAMTLSAFLLASLFALAYDWWRRNHQVVADRLRTAGHPAPSATPRPERTPTSA